MKIRSDRRRSLVLISLITGLSLTVPQLAWAACTKRDLAGKYELHIFATTRDGDATWTRCAMAVRGNGDLKTGTACANDRGEEGEVTGGSLTIRKSCAVSGSIEIDSTEAELDHGIMNKEKSTISALGQTDNEMIAKITATKR